LDAMMSFYSMMGVEAIMQQCQAVSQTMLWVGIKAFIVVTGLLANGGLMWILLSSKKPRSPSEVLALNLAVLDMVICLCLPMDIYKHLRPLSAELTSVNDALGMLKILGCPLLLTFMCFECYLAVARPLAYIKLGRWEYRAAMCACAWMVTLAAAICAYFLGVDSMILYLALTMLVLFLLMLLCLVGIVCVLCQSGPGEGSANNVPLKRRALKNILAVAVPAVVAYGPLVVMLPFVAVIKSQYNDSVPPEQCKVLHVLLVFPNLGVYIGPMFYLSRVRQLLCWKRNEKGQEQTQASFKTQAG